MPDVTIAPATPEDVRAIQIRRHVDETTLRLSLELADAGATWVARDEGDAIGLVIASINEGERYVGDVFVEPSFRGQDVGSRLLDAAFGDSADAARTLLVDPSDHASTAMAVRRGLASQTSLLSIAGAIPREDEIFRMAAGDYRFEVGAIDPSMHAFGLNALDRETRGIVRPEMHEGFAQSANGQAFFLNGEMVGYAYVWPDGRIGPLATTSAAYLVQLFAFSLVTLTRIYGASWCTLSLAGTNVRIGRAALRTGLRIEEARSIASDVPSADLSRYAGFHKILF